MNKETWIQALGDFKHLSALSIVEIEAMAKVYPFAQPIQLLLAKKSQIQQHSAYEHRLLVASAHHADRAWLYERMNHSELEQLKIIKEKKAKKVKKIAKAKETPKIVPLAPAVEEKPVISKKEKPRKKPKKTVQKATSKKKPKKKAAKETTEKVITKSSLSKNKVDAKGKKKESKKKLLKNPGEKEIEKKLASSNVHEKAKGIKNIPIENLKTSLARKKKAEAKNSESLSLAEGVKSQDYEGLSEFTAWLLTLDKKKAVSTQGDDYEEVNNYRSTQKKEEIISEPLADLLVEQGHIEKAIDMYEKLSLLNPSKSVYFARKIENLKKNK